MAFSRILLVGASGFIGQRLLAALLGAGQSLVATSRTGSGTPCPGVEWRALDLERLADDPDGFPWPAGVDLVINAAGALLPDSARLERLQADGPKALFDLAARHGAAVLQLSALGAGDHPDVPFLASKARADAHLLGLGIPAVVLRPSLVLGEGGASSGWLEALACLPVAPLPDVGVRSRPVHVDDLAGAVLALVRHWPAQPCAVPLVGPDILTQGGLLDLLRRVRGRGPGRWLRLPGALAALGARAARGFGWRALDPQLMTLARRDNLAEPDALAALCGYRAVPLALRLKGGWPQPERVITRLMRPAMLAVLALIWLGTAFVCLGPGYDWGLRIMADMGVDGWPASLAVVSGSLLDAALGLGLLVRRWRVRALQAQLGLMLVYTLLITLLLPHYWADPYAAVGKNLVLMVATLWGLWLEPPPRTPAR